MRSSALGFSQWLKKNVSNSTEIKAEQYCIAQNSLLQFFYFALQKGITKIINQHRNEQLNPAHHGDIVTRLGSAAIHDFLPAGGLLLEISMISFEQYQKYKNGKIGDPFLHIGNNEIDILAEATARALAIQYEEQIAICGERNIDVIKLCNTYLRKLQLHLKNNKFIIEQNPDLPVITHLQNFLINAITQAPTQTHFNEQAILLNNLLCFPGVKLEHVNGGFQYLSADSVRNRRRLIRPDLYGFRLIHRNFIQRLEADYNIKFKLIDIDINSIRTSIKTDVREIFKTISDHKLQIQRENKSHENLKFQKLLNKQNQQLSKLENKVSQLEAAESKLLDHTVMSEEQKKIAYGKLRTGMRKLGCQMHKVSLFKKSLPQLMKYISKRIEQKELDLTLLAKYQNRKRLIGIIATSYFEHKAKEILIQEDHIKKLDRLIYHFLTSLDPAMHTHFRSCIENAYKFLQFRSDPQYPEININAVISQLQRKIKEIIANHPEQSTLAFNRM